MYLWQLNNYPIVFQIEQLKQKKEKKDRSKLYTIRHSYSGAIFPVSKGLKVCCRPPFTDEPRIPLKIGDEVRVTRWKKQWLYGDKILMNANKQAGMKTDINHSGLFHGFLLSFVKLNNRCFLLQFSFLLYIVGVNRIRGWFPRKCAVEIVKDNGEECQKNNASGDASKKTQ